MALIRLTLIMSLAILLVTRHPELVRGNMVVARLGQKHIYWMVGKEMWKYTKGQHPIRDIQDDGHEATMGGLFWDVGEWIMQAPHFAFGFQTERALSLPELESPTGFVRAYRDTYGPRRTDDWTFYNDDGAMESAWTIQLVGLN
ncbi:MAG: hypothetical protein M1816_001215 [Peltula sp. TS41687]|nr:MAG: hypothetical protein M1816_001215 [Peltula sp. TS41687]